MGDHRPAVHEVHRCALPRRAVRGGPAGAFVPLGEGGRALPRLVVVIDHVGACGLRVVAGTRSCHADGFRSWHHGYRFPAVLAALAGRGWLEGPAVSGLRKRYSLKPLPAIPGTHCGPPAEAGTRSPSGDASDCNAVRCSVQYHAWPFRESDRLCGTRVPS